jgi:SOCS box
MIHNARRCTDILCIYELALLILQYGGNPNISVESKQPAGCSFGQALSMEGTSQMRHLQIVSASEGTSDSGLRNSFRRQGRNSILFYFISLILRKEFILTDPDKTYVKIINLCYATMHHDILYFSLRSLHNYFVVQVPTKSTEFLINYICNLCRRPRSLKEICRVTIYESLNHRLAQNINRLNMPVSIKDYVLNFE